MRYTLMLLPLLAACSGGVAHAEEGHRLGPGVRLAVPPMDPSPIPLNFAFPYSLSFLFEETSGVGVPRSVDEAMLMDGLGPGPEGTMGLRR